MSQRYCDHPACHTLQYLSIKVGLPGHPGRHGDWRGLSLLFLTHNNQKDNQA